MIPVPLLFAAFWFWPLHKFLRALHGMPESDSPRAQFEKPVHV